jgi:hypothetical protein
VLLVGSEHAMSCHICGEPEEILVKCKVCGKNFCEYCGDMEKKTCSRCLKKAKKQ